VNAAVDSAAFFAGLADHMNAHPERFASLGEAEMVVALVMDRPEGPFRLRLRFAGLGCTEVDETDAIGAGEADFRLEGSLEAWRQMFDDIAANGRATGLFTLNSLALMGDRIACTGDDPMGLDKFSRFNQTLQEFFDGAARESATAG
jgi:hypothetical protein